MILTLASQSPRRRERLAQLGIELEVSPAHVDEAVHAGEPADRYVSRVAREKARAVRGEVVLAADTSVVLHGRVLGKPRDAEDARIMLRALSAGVHEVITAVCARRGEREEELRVATAVRFAELTTAQVAWYAATGEGLDKAGGYALQGAAGAFVLEVRGSVSNVVGLPLAETMELLRRLGFPLPWDARP